MEQTMIEQKKMYSLETRTIDIYLQKSQKFLYPLLKIGSKDKFQPEQTYLSWKDEVTRAEHKLICVYDLLETPEYRMFEKAVLFKNDYFDDFKEGASTKGVYIFTLNSFQDDMIHFMNGKYSQFSARHKKTLQEFYTMNKFSKEYMDSFLFPEKYYEVYAKLLNVDVGLLKSVGELCDPPDFRKEQLTIKSIPSKLLT